MLPALRDSAASFVPVILNALLLMANQLGAIQPGNEAPCQPPRFNLADATVDDSDCSEDKKSAAIGQPDLNSMSGARAGIVLRSDALSRAVQATRRRKVFLPSCSTLPSSSAAEANSWLGSLSFSPSKRAAPPLIWRRASLLLAQIPTALSR